jgi:DNA-binding MarR family transcriptional regulator
LAATKDKKNYGLALQELGREMSVHTIMFHSAVAERLGLNATDQRCFDYVLRQNGVTAGQLSEFTGLTSGAITGVIDRLEKGRFVKRQPDPKDRRKVVIVPLTDRLPEIYKLFESLGHNMAETMNHYSAREAKILVDFMQRAVNVMRQENLKLRSQPNGKPKNVVKSPAH